ncbi:MAG: hypothetical protein GY906_39110 [bacterium]|nr:hypothetical protein [bacterium]
MPKYRKKPVVIEAFQLAKDEYPDWAKDASSDGTICGGSHSQIFIKTMEGTMEAGFGDWIIQGVKGELYPCKDDIFRATYEEVVDATT